MKIRCAICGMTANLVSDLIEGTWIPSFYDGHEEYGPVCGSCYEDLLQIGKDGEVELKEQYRGRIVFYNRERLGESGNYLVINLTLN